MNANTLEEALRVMQSAARLQYMTRAEICAVLELLAFGLDTRQPYVSEQGRIANDLRRLICDLKELIRRDVEGVRR